MVLYSRSGEDIDRGLVGYWKLDDLKLSGATTAIDRAKFNDGTINGCTNTEGINGLNNDAMFFDGVDDYVNCENGEDLEEYTYTMWIKPTCNGDAAQSIFSGYSTSYWNNGVWIYASLKYIRARRRRETTNSEAYIASAVIKPNEWQHIAVVMTADKYLKIYLNGVEGTYDTQTQGAGDVVEYGQDYLIGGLTVSGSSFQGNISNVQVYNRALTDGEISKLYRLKL